MPRPALLLPCLLAAVLILSACGSSSNGSPSANAADNALKFARCMREHGIKNFPDPQTSGGGAKLMFKAGAGGPDPKTMEAAQAACRHFVAAGERKLTPQEKVEHEEQVNRFARCMREHGVEVHASSSNGNFQIQIHPGAGGGPNPESPAFQRAQKACQGLLPSKGGPSGGPSTSKGGGGSAGFSVGG